MTDEQFKKAEYIKKEISRNEVVAKMLSEHEINDRCLTNLRITLHNVPGLYEAMANIVKQENEKLLKQFEEL